MKVRRFYLYAAILATYLCTAGGRLAGVDALSMYSVAKSLVTHGWFDAGDCAPNPRENFCVPGVDGRNYAGFGLIPSLVAAPVVALGGSVAKFTHQNMDIVAGLFVSLVNSFVGPFICLLVAWLLEEMGYSWRVACLVALTLAFASPLWQQCVKGFWSEPLFTLLCISAVVLVRRLSVLALAAAGFCFGLACGTRVYGVILAPALLIYVWLKTRESQPQETRYLTMTFLKNSAAFSVPLVLCLAGIGYFNFVRFGSPLKTGYHGTFPTLGALMSEPLLPGLFGNLFDGEVGLVWFVPWVLVLLLIWKRYWRTHRDEAVLIALVTLIQVIFFSKYTAWHGGPWGDGPRLLLPCVPFLALPLADLYDQLMAHGLRSKTAVIGLALVVLSACIQLVRQPYPSQRYYNEEIYREALGQARGPFEHALILRTVSDLPDLLRYEGQLKGLNRTGGPRREQPDRYESARESIARFRTADDFLLAAGGVNLVAPDLMLVKMSIFGIPRMLAALIALLLIGASAAFLAGSLRGNQDELRPAT